MIYSNTIYITLKWFQTVLLYTCTRFLIQTSKKVLLY